MKITEDYRATALDAVNDLLERREDDALPPDAYDYEALDEAYTVLANGDVPNSDVLVTIADAIITRLDEIEDEYGEGPEDGAPVDDFSLHNWEAARELRATLAVIDLPCKRCEHDHPTEGECAITLDLDGSPIDNDDPEA